MTPLELLTRWAELNRLADAEDIQGIRDLLDEAGIRAGAHVGLDPEDFTVVIVAEWVFGQWVDMLDNKSPFLNSARNISHHQYDLTINAVNDLLARHKMG